MRSRQLCTGILHAARSIPALSVQCFQPFLSPPATKKKWGLNSQTPPDWCEYWGVAKLGLFCNLTLFVVPHDAVVFNNALRGANMTHTIYRLPKVRSESGYSRSTIYLRIAQGLWTSPVNLGPRAVGWPAAEVVALNLARIEGKSDQQIRQLVSDLLDSRKKCRGPSEDQKEAQ